MEENQIEQSAYSKFVYNLIYPAILGSILYSLLPLGSSQTYLIGFFIFTFYILDYIHLYFVMDNRFSQSQKNGFRYITFDLAVSVLLFIAYSYNENHALGVLMVALIPICFLGYSVRLKYCVRFYKVFTISTVIYALLFYFNFNRVDPFLNLSDEKAMLYLLAGMNIVYFIYVGYQLSNSSKRKKYA